MKHRIIFTFILLTFMWSSYPDFIGEELKYAAGFRFFPAGEAILTFSADSLNEESVYKLTTSVKTNSFLDAFYEVRDEIQSWLNPNNLSLKKTVQSIREGSYHQDYESIIQGDSLAVSADNYARIFKKKIPLNRMLRRQINHTEYIALKTNELKAIGNNTEIIKFIIPEVKKLRGYYATEMKIVPLGEIKTIQFSIILP